jgi:hypothetical protein
VSGDQRRSQTAPARNGIDVRSAARRRADALIAICRRALDAGELARSRRVYPG